MWNRLPAIILFAGFISIIEVFPQDSGERVIVAPEESVIDSVRVSPEITFIDPTGLTRFQRDSIIGAIPKDTASLTALRHFEGDLAAKYASDSGLDYERNINKSFLQRLKEAFLAWLNRLLAIPDTSKVNDYSEKILEILLVVVFLAAAYIAVRLFMNHRGRWFFAKKNEAVTVDLSNVEKHIHEADFETLLAEAERKADTRQSVRLLYLWVLRTFADNRVIQWNPDKTNIDYLSEIGEKALQEQFRYLSYLYNYIWYGEFSINDSEYRDARETFLRHIKTKPGNE